MNNLHIDQEWMLHLLPQGLPLETKADNLLVVHSEGEPFRLFLRVERMKGG